MRIWSKVVFVKKTGTYGCQLNNLLSTFSPQQIVSYADSTLVLTARWNENKEIFNTVKVPFYPRFEIHATEILLNNIETTSNILSLTVVPKLSKFMILEACHLNILSINLISNAIAVLPIKSGICINKIKLNVESAALCTNTRKIAN